MRNKSCLYYFYLALIRHSQAKRNKSSVITTNNYYVIFSLYTADCPMATCNYADTTGEKSYKGPLHSLISPRFLKSQPVPGNSTRIKAELDRRLIQSQPASQTESLRFVNYMKFVVVSSLLITGEP